MGLELEVKRVRVELFGVLWCGGLSPVFLRKLGGQREKGLADEVEMTFCRLRAGGQYQGVVF